MILLTIYGGICAGNHHRLGASIVVDTGTVLPVFARNLYNPRCFIRYSDPNLIPDQWEQVHTHIQMHSLYCYLYYCTGVSNVY